MSTEDNKAIVRRYREAYNKNNLDALDAIVAKDLVSHSMLPGLPPGLEGGKMAHRVFLQSFPDTQTKTDMMIAEGNMVFEMYTASGTHKGEFMGFPATGKPFQINSMVIYRFANGKIVEMWGMNDAMALMMQLGMMPMPGG